ncbi:hypothetical protein PINS_up018277 [Pythium insidiosum]|nr:hypothetical protein PINS_up018277 [Pythium insidiosum]
MLVCDACVVVHAKSIDLCKMRALFLRRWRASTSSIDARANPLLRSIASSARGSGSALELPADIRRRVKEEPLAAAFDPSSVEKGWQAFWQDVLRERQHRSDNDKQFSMLLPPPNVTGALHIGHALTITIQDALARWHHMRGFDVQWIPGLDHAGIATQSVVERKLMKDEGRTRHDLGREAFVERVWQWNEQYGGRILHQIDQLGAIVDKEASFFTLDDKRSAAVVEAFVQLHERGLVYRKRRMVNWCPTLKTAISDIEVDSESLTGSTMKTLPGRAKPVEFGVMHRFKYQIAELPGEYLLVDTTRPETIFGDVAVAIHPNDSRYAHVHGMHVIHPFSGEQIPIVLDETLVNMELGTGVVKVTPAHDPKDYECGQRHGLPEPIVINKDGILCGDIDPRFISMDRFDARSAVIDELVKRDLYVEKNDHPTTLSLCSRSGDVIEPLLMPQWFVDCSGMAQRAVENVRNGRLLIEPKSHEHMWFYFLDNIRDWCVSRQLWWGHRIPAYHIRRPGQHSHEDEEWIVARSMEEARRKAIELFGPEAAEYEIEQDVDVLDTWFSSGLLPISVFDWPNNNPCDAPKYPLSVMETGSDILFFWVARMAMLCEEFSGEIPFKRVLLHPMVRDKSGRKMSKSLGNVIDPNHVIHGITLDALLSGVKEGNVSSQEMKKAEKELKREFPKGIPACGADALRYALASYLQQGRQINMDVQRVVSHRQFCNKIWNAVRYALPLLESNSSNDAVVIETDMSLADRWILSRLANVVQQMNQGLETNHLAMSVSAFHRFFVQELCDVYIEFSKPILYGNRNPSCEVSILLAKYPEARDVTALVNEQAENSMEVVLSVLHAVRSLKHTVKTLAPTGASSEATTVSIVCSPNSEDSILSLAIRDIEVQGRVSVQLAITDDVDGYSTGGPALSHSISSSCKVLLPMPIDPETPHRVKNEIQRLQKRMSKMKDTLQGLQHRISAAGYKEKVPESVQIQDSARMTQLETDVQAAKDSIDVLQALDAQY